jgi:predicted acylesterase/phospholipase RssA
MGPTSTTSVLASPTVNAGEPRPGRGLLVLADGAQAAFVAGAVAELARGGAVWERGAGAGLGAQVGVLGVLGEGVEAERRWVRDAELGCPLLRSRLAVLRETLGATPGAVLAADAWTLTGWLDPDGLAEHLAPEMAALPQRLARAERSFAVAVEDVGSGATGWLQLRDLPAWRAGEMLRVSATFPAGWGPEALADGGAIRRFWGGVGVAIACPPPWRDQGGTWDVVCGFPVPVSARPALGESLLELIQRREEVRAGAAVSAWRAGVPTPSLRVIAPTAERYLAWAGRSSADLGVEYPSPWERNGELIAAMVRFGAFVASGPGND